MTDQNTDADWACYREAKRLAAGAEYGDSEWVALKAAALARTGWTPPKVVDPDLVEARKVVAIGLEVSYPEYASCIVKGRYDDGAFVSYALAGIKQGRELERAALHIPIAEQIQDVSPPVVDPDVLRVRGLLHTHWLEEYGLSIAESLSAGHFDNDDDFIPALACYRAGLADGGAV